MITILFLLPQLLPYLGLPPAAGMVVYEQQINLHQQLGAENEEMKAYLPEFQTAQLELLFNEQAALFRPREETGDQEIEHEEDGNQIRIRTARMTNVLFQDFQNQQRVEQRDFFGKQFLIKSELKKRNWKVTGETRQILDYPCIKAITQDEDGKDILAWFTPAIPTPAGPNGLGQLPGLILEAELDDGAMRFTAREISLTPPPAEVMVPPTEGKLITQDKFDQLMEERMREMNASGEGGMKIIIRRN